MVGKIIKRVLLVFAIIMTVLVCIFSIYYFLVNKNNNREPYETVQKYIEYWGDNNTLGMMSLETKDASCKHNSAKADRLSRIVIDDVTDNELDEFSYSTNYEYQEYISNDMLKLFRVSFSVFSEKNDIAYSGDQSFSVTLINDEKRGWLIEGFGF